MRVSEIFYSIQGEGITMGIPAVFLRLTSCNLLCGNPQIKDLKNRTQEEIYQAQGDNATWTCDTIDVWLKGNDWDVNALAFELFEKYGQYFLEGAHLVITGGEPLLQQDLIPGLISELRRLLKKDVFVEIETNGTIVPSLPVMTQANLINCSPKLVNSGMTRDRRLKADAIKIINELAINGKAIFKFVVTSSEDLDEILVDFIEPYSIPSSRIFLMPGCSNQEQFQKVAPLVANICKTHGYNFSSRLQINLWNQTTGV